MTVGELKKIFTKCDDDLLVLLPNLNDDYDWFLPTKSVTLETEVEYNVTALVFGSDISGFWTYSKDFDEDKTLTVGEIKPLLDKCNDNVQVAFRNDNIYWVSVKSVILKRDLLNDANGVLLWAYTNDQEDN